MQKKQNQPLPEVGDIPRLSNFGMLSRIGAWCCWLVKYSLKIDIRRLESADMFWLIFPLDFGKRRWCNVGSRKGPEVFIPYVQCWPSHCCAPRSNWSVSFSMSPGPSFAVCNCDGVLSCLYPDGGV